MKKVIKSNMDLLKLKPFDVNVYVEPKSETLYNSQIIQVCIYAYDVDHAKKIVENLINADAWSSRIMSVEKQKE